MTEYITQANSLITRKFPDKWWEAYHFDSDSYDNFDTEFAKFQIEISKLTETLFDLLNSSILSGEFSKIDNFDELLGQLSNTLDNIFQPFPPNPEVQSFLQESVNNNFISCLKVAIKMYSSLFIEAKLKFDIDNRKFIMYHSPEVNQHLENNNFNDTLLRYISFLISNLQVAGLDIKLTPEKEDFLTLTSISEDLLNIKKLGGHKFSILLKEKTDFLRTKWILRQQHLKSTTVYSVYNNKETELGVEEATQNIILGKWKAYIESHYEFVINWKSDIAKDFNSLKNKNLSQLKLIELHRLIKYFKDVNGDFLKLNEIRKEIQERHEVAKISKPRNERFAYSIALIYAINNEFSFLLQTTDVLSESVARLYDEILRLQNSTGIKNFFPQYKYLNYLVKKLEDLYDQKRALQLLSPLRDTINKCASIVEIYRENVEWCEDHYNYAFHLPYEECLLETQRPELPEIYICSSFLLPLSAEKYVPDFEINERRYLNLSTSVDIFENLEKEITDFTIIKSEIQARDIRSMEILGIFTAIVTFIAGSLPTFQYIKTPFQAFLFMFALSSSLSLFVLTILTISRGTERLKQKTGIVIFLFILSLAFWLLLVFFGKDPLS